MLLASDASSWITGDPWQSEIAPITGPMYQLFVFFMVTDPKTTVKSRKWQCVVVFFVAFVEMLLRLNQVVHAPLYALFLVGPTAMLIEIWLESRGNLTAGASRASPRSSSASTRADPTAAGTPGRTETS